MIWKGKFLSDQVFQPVSFEPKFNYAIFTDQNVSYPKALSREAKEMCKGPLTRNPSKKLECGSTGEVDVRGNQFFHRIDFLVYQLPQLYHIPVFCLDFLSKDLCTFLWPLVINLLDRTHFDL